MAEQCIFCKIVKGEIPAKKVYEDEKFFAFLDVNPRNPGYTIVIPREHYESVFDLPGADAGRMFDVVKKIAGMVKNAMKAQGVSISISDGRAAGQIIPHLHAHVIPRFLTEGPVGLEGILQVKRLDDSSMNKIAEAIRGSSADSRAEPKKAAEAKPVAKPAKKKVVEPEPEQEEDLGEDALEEINLDDI